MMSKVIRDGKVAVLYSPGYGTGWSTCYDLPREAVFHPVLVELVEENRHDEITEDLLERLFGHRFDLDYAAAYAKELEIFWVPEGKDFCIQEYDGNEFIVIEGDRNWYSA